MALLLNIKLEGDYDNLVKQIVDYCNYHRIIIERQLIRRKLFSTKYEFSVSGGSESAIKNLHKQLVEITKSAQIL